MQMENGDQLAEVLRQVGAIYENVDNVSENYTITAGSNGMSVGPMTIDAGFTVTIPAGQRWVILYYEYNN